MKKNYAVTISFIFTVLLGGCLDDHQTDEPTVIIEPPLVQLVSTDTISSGSYMGFTIGEDADEIYSQVTALQASDVLAYLNVVGNVFDGLAGLQERLPLYQTIFFDEKPGTDGGVQITLTDGRVSSVFLNNGKKLNQWPEKPGALPAVRVGDASETLYAKLEKISSTKAYASRFEYIALLTKDLSRNYDHHMADSPEWYFAHTLADGKMDVVKLQFDEGKLNRILVNHYQQY
jgi:hypothetical protein